MIRTCTSVLFNVVGTNAHPGKTELLKAEGMHPYARKKLALEKMSTKFRANLSPPGISSQHARFWET